MIYYIQNTVSETSHRISGYFKTLDDAKEALKQCSDWYRPTGTGKIYCIELGLNKRPTLVYQA